MQRKIHRYMELKVMDESKNSVLQEELVDIAKNINELQYLNNKTIVITLVILLVELKDKMM